LLIAKFAFTQNGPDELFNAIEMKNFELIENDSLSIKKGSLSQDVNYIMVRYISEYETYFRLYSGDDTKEILRYSISTQNYISDTIFDINGDGYKDFAVYWYPRSGCCVADTYNCFIYNPFLNKFTEKKEIINPSFLPEQKKLFSMSYGFETKTIISEIIWQGCETDTLKQYYWKVNLNNNDFVKSDTLVIKQQENIYYTTTIPKEILLNKYISWFAPWL